VEDDRAPRQRLERINTQWAECDNCGTGLQLKRYFAQRGTVRDAVAVNQASFQDSTMKFRVDGE